MGDQAINAIIHLMVFHVALDGKQAFTKLIETHVPGSACSIKGHFALSECIKIVSPLKAIIILF